MPIRNQLYFILLLLSFVSGKDLILKLETKRIIDSLVSETSVKYLTKLAQVFAKKAAETFIKEIKNKEHLFNDSMRAEPVTKKQPNKHMPTTTQKSVIKEDSVLKEEEAYKLLEKPNRDGDNLGWHSQESTFEEEDRDEAKAVPVYGLVKVNGIYVRRLLGVRMI